MMRQAAVLLLACVVASVAAVLGAVVPCRAAAGWTSSPSIVAPYGHFIPEMLLDGILGAEWDDADEYQVVMGNYEARLVIKHDGVYFFVAMVIDTGRYFAGGFEAYVVFENGDGVDYSRGDDMISVGEWAGELQEADFTYQDTYDFLLDTSFGGTNDAIGAGRYDGASRRYVFEFRRAMASGDSRDIPLQEGAKADAIYGWASY